MALPCCLTCIHCTVSQASFTSVPQASFIHKCHSSFIHKCPLRFIRKSSVLQADIVQMIYFLTTWESSCIRTQVLYLTHSVLPDKALHFWLLGFNLPFFSNWNTGYLTFLILYWEFHSDFIHWFTFCFQSILLSMSIWIIKIDEDLVGIGIVIRNQISKETGDAEELSEPDWLDHQVLQVRGESVSRLN